MARNPKSEIQNPNSNIGLIIAGLDPSGGAGIIADIKTFSAFGCFAAAAITSVTFQNTRGVYGAVHQTAESVRRQVEPVIDDFELSAIKTGMLPTGDIIGEVARLVRENDLKNFVVDPVVRSTSGFDLIDDQALRVLIERLFPLADIVTPNLPEAERISGIKIETPTDIERAARLMQRLGARNVLIKGGHNSIVDFGFGILDCLDDGEGLAKPVSKKARDFLFAGDEKLTFEAEFIETTSTHGTGCTLASAIAANLSLGKPLAAAVETAKRYVTEAIRTAPNIGKGNGPINHFVRM